MNIIYCYWLENPNLKVVMAGDWRQITQIDGLVKKWSSQAFVRQMMPKLKVLTKNQRYDKELLDILLNLYDTGKVDNKHFKRYKECYSNICFYNKTRVHVNTKICEKFLWENPVEHQSLTFTNNITGKKEKLSGHFRVHFIKKDA